MTPIPIILALLLLKSTNAIPNFVAGGVDSSSTSLTMAYSQDGKNWTTLNSPFANQCGGVAYSPLQNKWVAAGSGINTLAYSLDGLVWIGLGSTVFPVQGNRVAYGSSQNLWIATGLGTNNLAYSQDAINWNYASTPFDTQANDVVFSNSLQRWVAVGSFSNAIAYSSDGKLWIGLGNSIFGPVAQGYSISFSSEVGQFIVGGQGVAGPFGYSLDGVNWVGHFSIFSTEVQGAAYGQGKWIITGNPTFSNVPFANSTNAISGIWTGYPSQTIISGGLDIIFNLKMGIWVTAGVGANSLVYSQDGITWNGGGNPFNGNGLVVATPNIDHPIPMNTLPTTLSGSSNYNSSQIPANQTVVLSGNLTIQGDLYVLGTLVMVNSSSLIVTGLLSISGSLVIPISPNNKPTILAQTIYAQGNLTIFLNEPIDHAFTITLAQYQSLEGSFSGLNVLTTSLVTMPYGDCLTSTLDYSSSALSLLVDFNSCSPPTSQNNSEDSAGMPVWIIALIVSIVAAFGITGAIIVTVLTRRAIIRRTTATSKELRKRATENMLRAVHDTPTL